MRRTRCATFRALTVVIFHDERDMFEEGAERGEIPMARMSSLRLSSRPAI